MTTSLSHLATSISSECRLALESAETAVEHARRAGELLTEARQSIPHGEWRRWVEAQCGISARTAQKYIRLHARWAEIAASDGARLGINESLALIAEPKRLPEAPAEDRTDLPFDLPEPGWQVAALIGEDDAPVDEDGERPIYVIVTATTPETGDYYHIEVGHSDDTESFTKRALNGSVLRFSLERVFLRGVSIDDLDWHTTEAEPMPGTSLRHKPYWSHPDTGCPELNAIEHDFWQARVAKDGPEVRRQYERLRDSGLWREKFPRFEFYVKNRFDTDEESLACQYWPDDERAVA